MSDIAITSFFIRNSPDPIKNEKLREPQKEGYSKVYEYYKNDYKEREVGIVLPVGCGKSGLITIIPFGLNSGRVLVLAPQTNIRDELVNNFDPNNSKYFYNQVDMEFNGDNPQHVVLSVGRRVNLSLLKKVDVVVANIQQLQGKENKWLEQFSDDFFDTILVDEAHHNVAQSWEMIRVKFPSAKIINFSATPLRADGKLMSGEIIYSYPIYKAIQSGYVKNIGSWILKPSSLEYINKDTGEKINLTSQQVAEKSETDAKFRNSIVQSQETLQTIADASINALNKIRQETGDKKHSIIASAMNYDHCHLIVAEYKSRGLRVDFIHSKENSKANQKVEQKLRNYELDVIVQVSKLGEGFDHKHLSVAAVFKPFRSLSPFVQFIGRIMRTVPENEVQKGIVVFHLGSNVAKVWDDFKNFSTQDQDFFKELLPEEEIVYGDGVDIIEVTPNPKGEAKLNPIKITKQSDIILDEENLIEGKDMIQAINILKENGITIEQLQKMGILAKRHVNIQDKFEANLKLVDSWAKNEVGKMLKEQGLKMFGRNLDPSKQDENFIYVKKYLDRLINSFLDISSGGRENADHEKVESLINQFSTLVFECDKWLRENH